MQCVFIFIASIFLGYLQRVALTNNAACYSSEILPKNGNDENEPADMKNPYKREDRLCLLCKLNITPDYKNARLLSQFQSSYTGRIYGRHITGLCEKKQKEVEQAIKLSQACGFMPIYHKALEFIADPKLYDPEKPIRPHPY